MTMQYILLYGKAFNISDITMLIERGTIRTWLYTSEFKKEKTQAELEQMLTRFQAKNLSLGLTGFLVSNGKAVMQLLEGLPTAVEPMKGMIMQDSRHTNIISEVWELENARAYPRWSMRAIMPSETEILFKEIELASVESISTNIARLLFDTTFGA